jgi:hypothetical protein
MQHTIDKRLFDLDCTVVDFIPITGGLIGRTRLTQAMQGEPGKSLDHNLLDKLVTLLDEMAELKRTSLIAPDWADTQNIREQLAQRRALKDAAKYDATSELRNLLLEQHGTDSE